MPSLNFKPLTNNLKKFVASLKDKDKRKESGLFVADGYRVVEELINTKANVEFIVISSIAGEDVFELAREFLRKGIEVYFARHHQFEQICQTKTPQGILAVVRSHNEEIALSFPVVVLDGISDPGNLGTIIRTIDWFGSGMVVCSEDSVDRFNSKVIRGSMGSFFRVNTIQVSSIEHFLKNECKDLPIFGATLTAKEFLNQIIIPKKVVLVFGSEAFGIRSSLTSILNKEFKIEGKGHAQSLNLGIAVSITLYKYFLQHYV
ncbi:MAG: TrmH family RNA methyltransferase [Candidatus Kapaibacteriales bacterium]